MSYRMTERMQELLGYDAFGNNFSLMCAGDREILESGNWIRASGDVECICGAAYRLHPPVQGCLSLIRTCQGLVKL